MNRVAPSTVNAANRRERGVSLLTTLIILSAISLTVISFLSLMRHESMISDFQADDLRADLAVAAAFEDAKSLLIDHTATDDYLVSAITVTDSLTGLPTRYTFISQPGAEQLAHIPLFAGGREQSAGMPRLNHASTALLASKAQEAPKVDFEGSLPVSRDLRTFQITHLVNGTPQLENPHPETRLITPTTNSNGDKRIRYTYWIEDLQGLPNLDAVGSWTDDFDAGDTELLAANQIRYGYGPNDARTGTSSGSQAGLRFEIPGSLSRFGFQFPQSFRGQSAVGQMAPGLSPREIFLHPWDSAAFEAEDHPFAHANELAAERFWLAGSGVPRKSGTQSENRFSVGLLPYYERPLIPWGHDYQEEGSPRYSINRLVRQKDVDEITRIIETNLPKFTDRKGGFPHDYVKTVAANVIDYADEDSEPTFLGGVYRGVDSYPIVNEIFFRFLYEKTRRGDEIVHHLTATPYAEFWNSTNQDSHLPQARLEFEFRKPFGFLGPDGAFNDFAATEPVRNDALSTPVSVDLRANEFKVVRMGDIEWEIPVFVPEGVVDTPISLIAETVGSGKATKGHFEIHLNNPASPGTPPLHQESSDGFKFREFSLSANKDDDSVPNKGDHFRDGDYFWRSTAPCLTSTGPKTYSNYGDPWMGLYTSSQQEEIYYVNDGTPGGRNFRFSKSDDGQWFKNQQRFHDWPDKGYTPEEPSGPPRSLNSSKPYEVTPDQAETSLAVPTDPAMAPFRINNSGRYWSVSELGNLHDHHMWHPQPTGGYDYPSNQAYDNDPEHLVWDLPDEAEADSRWGGGSTLRIGRKEFTKFDKPGMRASQLLDLFHAGINGTNLTINAGTSADYEAYDPRDHQPPPTGRTSADATSFPYSAIYTQEDHAESPFRKIYGQLNLNSVPTVLEIETILRGMFSSSALMVDPANTDQLVGPTFLQETDPKRAPTHGLDPDACSRIARRLLADRPYYSPSHLARVVGQLVQEEDAMPKTKIEGKDRQFFNDAEAEETFARLFNLTNFSSRHFRIFAYGEVLAPKSAEPVVIGRSAKVFEVFLRPVRDNATHEIDHVECEVLSVTDL
ncbi:MAG: hypothetical protein KDN19_20400 [Verrucomicrobiae bacterium]|nr:hypothetical protein [Verrucomicrobiae bacterium]